MKCYVCNGTGKRFVPTNKNAITGNGYTADCLICNGTGKLVLTNEKWLHTLNTEQLADVIADFYLLGFTHGHNQMDITSRTKWLEWLKEEHHD